MPKKKTTSKPSPALPFQNVAEVSFLGWEQPILHSAVDYLLERYAKGNLWDMDQVLVVLPGSMASRRLQVLLAQRAAQGRLVLRPPRFLTLGKLPEELYHAKLPFASELTQIMAWVQVLRSTPALELQPLLFEVPSVEQLGVWMDLAKLLGSLHKELASDLLDFKDVAYKLAGTVEEPRWQILAQLQRRYLDVLHEAGLWDIQSARRFALEHGEVSPVEHEVVLIGTVDLNRAQRQFLSAIGPKVRVLVGAPETFAQGFDRDGTLRSSFWQNLQIPIDQEQIHVRTSAVQASQELAVQLAKLGKTRSVRDITIGVPDPSLVPALQETLAQYQVSLRYGPGMPIYATPPMKVLRAIEDYLRDPNVENFSNLIRIPWIETWLHARAVIPSKEDQNNPESLPANFLAIVDGYLKQTLLRSVSVPHWPEAPGRDVFVAIVESIDQWLKPLQEGARSLDAWAKPLRQIFLSLSELEQIDRTKPDGHLILRGCREINAVLDRLANVPPKLNLKIELAEALAWLEQQLQGVQIPPLADDSAIEMLGWLDVALDDAPVLMMTGLHDGVVPESVNSDAFLPNRLRSELGLLDNARRYARDAYVMMACLHTREQVEFIMNRFSSNSDPLTPSRLMMAVPTEELPDRVAKLISQQEDSPGVQGGWSSRPLQSDIQIPRPDPTKRLGAMAVTDFKKYSECPYRFYLRKLCRANAIEHLPQELDGGGFGDMVHSVLEGLISSEVAESTDPQQISNWLSKQLDAWVKVHFGSVLPPALVVQVEQAKLRFAEFAKHQAQWTAEGWQIKHIEHNVDRSKGIVWNLPHGQMILHGRIDRIDVNKKTGEVAVWDYKTGDATEEPRKNHLKGQEWTDWQLPLYGLLIESLGYKDPSQVRFGYILLPKNVAETKFVSANFTAQEHHAAIESAKELADRVLQGQFWPPSDNIQLEWDDYRYITQRTVIRPWDPTLEEQVPKHKEQKSQVDPAEEKFATESDSNQQSAGSKRASKDRGPILPKMIMIEPVVAEGCALDEWFEPSMILASAGTGKTFQLASRAVRLLFTDQPLDSILATTFTRKAAGEILHRILEWLSEASRSVEGLYRLQTVIAPMKIEHAHARYQLSRLCSHLHRFRVSTLDSFYSQLAKSFALELKLPPGWTLLDTAQEEILVRDAITQLFDNIDHQQLRTLVSQLSKGMAVRGIRIEVENLITDAYELFRQAPEDAWAKIQVPKGPDQEQVHQAAKKVVVFTPKNAKIKDAKDKALALFRSQQWDEFLAETIVTACLSDQPTYSRSEIDPELVAALRVLQAKAKTEFLSIRRIQNEASHQVLEQYHRALEKLKQSRRVVTFSDIADRLANWMRSLLEQHNASGKKGPLPQMQSISHRMDSSIDHLLLDEFQDTSPNQWLILKPFAEAIVAQKASSNKRTSFFVVGDTKQAIYAWRGGVSEILESVGEQVENIKQQKLSESYRSSPIIMDFVNQVFHGLAKHPNYLSDDPTKRGDGVEHPVISKWVDRYFIDHSTARTSLPGVVEFWNAQARPGEDRDDQSESAVKKAIPTDIDLDIADAIAQLHRRSDQITIGVLTRTNSDVAKMISLLRDRGVEASQEGGNPLIDTAPVLVVQSALKLAQHSGDTLAYFHIMHCPLKAFWDPETASDANKISVDLRHQLDTLGFGGTVSALVNCLAPHCTLRDQERLEQLIDEAYRFDAAKQSVVHEFIDRIATTRVATQAQSVVRVMTIHQSKGLEFDAVFIPAIDQPIIRQAPRLVAMRDSRTGPPISIMRNVNKKLLVYLPIEWQVACQEVSYQQLGEALCLFYVALTRARHALYLFATPSKNPIKQWGSALHSVFANEQTCSEPGVLIYRNGQADWVEKLVAKEEIVSIESEPNVPGTRVSDTDALKVELRLENTLLRNPQWIAPSQQPQAESLEPLVDLWKPDDTAATVIGKLIHRWFEEIHMWIDDFSPDKNHLLEIAASALTKDEMMQLQLDQQAVRFLKYCESKEIRSVFEQDRYRSWHKPTTLRLEVSNERRFLISIDDQLIRGVIDRCVLGWDQDRVIRAEVIDYKTDARPGNADLASWVKERAEHHSGQLQMYRKVLCRQFSLHPEMVQVTLVLLSEQQVVSI